MLKSLHVNSENDAAMSGCDLDRVNASKAGAESPPRSAKERFSAASPYVVILASAGYLYWVADGIEFDKVPGRIGPDAWPKIILGLTIIACLWGAVKAVLFAPAKIDDDLIREAETNEEISVEADEHEIYPGRVWAAVGGTLAYIWAQPLIGFFLSTLVFLGFIVYVGGYRKLIRVGLISVLGTVLFMIIFVRVVYVSLPLGAPPFESISLAVLAVLNY